jgi:phospholipid/cholesterol/gamma-HCH transport system substrate-binding protein
MRRAIRKHFFDFAAIIGLAAIAAAVGIFILAHQRLRMPWEAKPFTLKADFSTAQAVTPGQGQTVRVSGVRIGDIAKVDLHDGIATVTMDVDAQYKGLVHTDASALLRPKTGLKDMFIELDPGSNGAPKAKPGWTIPLRSTLPDVNPDEVLASLDADTRDSLRLLISGAGEGLNGRAPSLRDVLRRFEPTHRELAEVAGAVATRHTQLRRLVTSLERLNGALATRGEDVSELVNTSAAVFRAFASEESNIGQAVRDLPPTLRQTTTALADVDRFARVLKPAATDLRPAVRDIAGANKALTPLALQATPQLHKDIRPFVRASRPLVRKLPAPATRLAAATPDLTRSFTVLNHLFNMVGYNQNGREAPGAATRDEGYLFWIAWLDHIGSALFSSSDANGPFRPVTVGATCSTAKQLIDDNDSSGQLGMLLGPMLLDPNVCGTGSTG